MDYLVQGMEKLMKFVDNMSKAETQSEKKVQDAPACDFPVTNIVELKKVEMLLRSNKNAYDTTVWSNKDCIAVVASLTYSINFVKLFLGPRIATCR